MCVYPMHNALWSTSTPYMAGPEKRGYRSTESLIPVILTCQHYEGASGQDSDDTVTADRLKKRSATVLCTGRASKRLHGVFGAFNAMPPANLLLSSISICASPLQLAQRPNVPRGRCTNADGDLNDGYE